MYYRITRNLKQYYKNENELIKRIESINNYFNIKCNIINSYFKLILIYDNEVVKINLQHHGDKVENLSY